MTTHSSVLAWRIPTDRRSVPTDRTHRVAKSRTRLSDLVRISLASGSIRPDSRSLARPGGQLGQEGGDHP